ncbi:hypothetical protein [Devosia nitrariae]|uniref:Lipoprotein n=1 Tax=Devosia nitrariae TaxID=2071872 RepID=A0ABQ5W237_9HYPH|nr:hypothetical protein [Devosia nitrariae]GLQ53740.1 hypothetical protein GCM10010862_09990 [Devosia nitrariae]
MQKFIVLLAAMAMALAGCTTNTNIQNLQFSGETDPYLANYREVVWKAVEPLPREGDVLLVSEPMTAAGMSAFGPRRWYVCVRGLRPGRADRPTLYDSIEGMLGERPQQAEAVLFLTRGATPVPQHTHDSPLCRQARFSTLSASS